MPRKIFGRKKEDVLSEEIQECRQPQRLYAPGQEPDV
jgi:hypothetical protein